MQIPSNPFTARLSDEQQALIAQITASNREKFGHGLFFMEEGGAPSAGDGAGNPANVAQTGDQPAGDPTGQSGAPTPQIGSGEPNPDGEQNEQDLATQPQWVQDLVKGLRQEAASERTKSRDAAKAEAAEEAKASVLEEFGKALGFIKDDTATTPSVEDVTATVAEKDATIADLNMRLAVTLSAAKHGGNAEALLDSERFKNSVKALAAGDDYADKVGDLIKTALEANPALKVQVAGQGGTEMQGPGTPAGERPKSFAEALRRG